MKISLESLQFEAEATGFRPEILEKVFYLMDFLSTFFTHHFRVSPATQTEAVDYHFGLVEGMNNKIRVIQRRAYRYRDEDYMRLKVLTAFLPR